MSWDLFFVVFLLHRLIFKVKGKPEPPKQHNLAENAWDNVYAPQVLQRSQDNNNYCWIERSAEDNVTFSFIKMRKYLLF